MQCLAADFTYSDGAYRAAAYLVAVPAEDSVGDWAAVSDPDEVSDSVEALDLAAASDPDEVSDSVEALD